MLKGHLYLKVSSKYDSTVTASPYFVVYRLLNDVNKAKKFYKKKGNTKRFVYSGPNLTYKYELYNKLGSKITVTWS